MTPEQLFQILKNAIRHDAEKGYDFIDLGSPLLPQLGQLVGYLNLTTLRVIKVVLNPPTQTGVTLDGEADFLNASWSVQLIGVIDGDGNPQF
ncbi:MAG TPA: hypothetical protein VD861_14975, partial [Pyrinomonadaceae bacterium]|nr:hypothetical protein [Pyrinomonadaceae bacterium]